jgi:hypothetical protein
MGKLASWLDYGPAANEMFRDMERELRIERRLLAIEAKRIRVARAEARRESR